MGFLNVHGAFWSFREDPGGPNGPLKCSKLSKDHVLRGLQTLDRAPMKVDTTLLGLVGPAFESPSAFEKVRIICVGIL